MIRYIKKSCPLSTYVSQGVLSPLQHLFMYRFFCNHAYLSCWTVNFRGQELCLFVTCLIHYLQPLMRCLAHSGAQQIWYLCVERYTCCPLGTELWLWDVTLVLKPPLGLVWRWDELIQVKQLAQINCSVNKDLSLIVLKKSWHLHSGMQTQLTYREGHKSVIFLHRPIGIEKVVRVEVIWFLKVMWVVESRAQDGIDFCALREGHKIERYLHFLPQPTPTHHDPRVSDKAKKRSRVGGEREPRRAPRGRCGSPVRCCTLGRMYPRKWVSLVTMWGTPMGTRSENLWISWMTASVYGIWALSSRAGGRCEPITWSISLWILSAQKRGTSEPQL